jgi:hypothetical protein
MASNLSDIWAPPSTPPLGFTLANLNQQQTDVTTDAGLQQSRMIRNFSQYNLPDLVNNQAAKGAFASSATHDKADRLRQFANDDYGDSVLRTGRTVAGLATNGILAAGGIQL